MISVEKLATQLSNLKERPVPMPQDNTFTQSSSFQMRLNELKNLEEVNADIGEFIDYTMKNEFISQSVPNQDLSNLEEIDETNVPTDSFLSYTENEVVNIPEVINNIIPNKDEWYIYGLCNPDSLYKAILLLSQSDYILKNNTDKENYVPTFKREIAIKLEQMFKKYKYYNKHRFVKTDMLNQLLNMNVVNYPLMILLADYIKSNICILDIITKKYTYYISNTAESSGFNFILKDNNDVYLPVMNSNGDHLIDESVLEYIKIYFERDCIPRQFKERICVFKNEEIESNNTENNSPESNNTENNSTENNSPENNSADEVLKLNLSRSEKSYGLKELQDIATRLGIDTHKIGKKKTINKTKNELYNEIKSQN